MQQQNNKPGKQGLLQQINLFLGFNKHSQQQQPKSQSKNNDIKSVEKHLSQLSRQDNFYETVYELIMQYTLEYDQLTLATILLKNKFRVHFDKIDEHSIQPLEQMLKSIIKKYAVSPPFTFVSNICICMVCLYLKRADLLKETFQQEGLLKYYQSFVKADDGNTNSIVISLDYFYRALEQTPEQATNSNIVMEESLKDRVRSFLKYSQYSVLNHLNTVSQNLYQNNLVKRGGLFNALRNWLDVGFNEDLFTELPQHFLAKKLFEHSMDSDYTSEAAECLMVIIKRIKIADRNSQLYQFLASGIFQLVRSINKHLKTNPDSVDISNETIAVICDFGLLSSQLFIMNYSEDVKEFLTSTIDYLKIRELQDNFASIVDFWECLIKDIADLKALDNQWMVLIHNVYAAVCFKTKYEMKMILHMNEVSEHVLGDFYKEAQQILEWREIAEDFFLTTALTIGRSQYLDFVIGCIKQLPRGEQQIFWPYLQAYLNSLIEAIKKLPKVTESVQVLVLSYNDILTENLAAIKNAYLRVFRSLMTIKQTDITTRNELVKHIFSLIAANFSGPLTHYRAHQAFSKGCEQRPEFVIANIEGFLNLLTQFECREQIVRGLMHVIISDEQVLRQCLPKILTVQLSLFKTNNILARKDIYHSLYVLLKILTYYKNHHHYAEVVSQFAQQVWPLVLQTIKEPSMKELDQDYEVERAIKLAKHLMRALKEAFVPFLDSLFSTVLTAYRKHAICSYIYILQIAITVYYNDPNLYDHFKGLYTEFCQVTYTHLQLKDSAGIADCQLLIDDFIGMNKRFFIYNSKIVLESGQLPSLIQTCINLSSLTGTNLPKVSKACSLFFQTIFMVYWSDNNISRFNIENENLDKFQKNPNNEHLYQQLKQYVLPKVGDIVSKLIMHMQSAPLESISECLLDALNSEVKAFPKQNANIWGDLLNGIPAELLTVSEKREIFEALPVVGSANIDESEEAVSRIKRLLCRLNKRCINLARSQL